VPYSNYASHVFSRFYVLAANALHCGISGSQSWSHAIGHTERFTSFGKFESFSNSFFQTTGCGAVAHWSWQLLPILIFALVLMHKAFRSFACCQNQACPQHTEKLFRELSTTVFWQFWVLSKTHWETSDLHKRICHYRLSACSTAAFLNMTTYKK